MDRYRNNNYKQNSREREQRDGPYYSTMNNHSRKHYNRPYRNGEPEYSPRINQRYSPRREYHNERGTSPRGGKTPPRYGQAESERTKRIVNPLPSYSGIFNIPDLFSPLHDPEDAFMDRLKDHMGQATSTHQSPRPVVDDDGDTLMTDADSMEAAILAELGLCLRNLEVAWKSAQKAKTSWRRNVSYRLKAMEDFLESKYEYRDIWSDIPLDIL